MNGVGKIFQRSVGGGGGGGAIIETENVIGDA